MKTNRDKEDARRDNIIKVVAEMTTLLPGHVADSQTSSKDRPNLESTQTTGSANVMLQ